MGEEVGGGGGVSMERKKRYDRTMTLSYATLLEVPGIARVSFSISTATDQALRPIVYPCSCDNTQTVIYHHPPLGSQLEVIMWAQTDSQTDRQTDRHATEIAYCDTFRIYNTFKYTHDVFYGTPFKICLV